MASILHSKLLYIVLVFLVIILLGGFLYVTSGGNNSDAVFYKGINCGDIISNGKSVDCGLVGFSKYSNKNGYSFDTYVLAAKVVTVKWMDPIKKAAVIRLAVRNNGKTVVQDFFWQRLTSKTFTIQKRGSKDLSVNGYSLVQVPYSQLSASLRSGQTILTTVSFFTVDDLNKYKKSPNYGFDKFLLSTRCERSSYDFIKQFQTVTNLGSYTNTTFGCLPVISEVQVL